MERCTKLTEFMTIDVASLMSITSLEELTKLDTSVAKIHPTRSQKQQLSCTRTTHQLEQLTCIRFHFYDTFFFVSKAPPIRVMWVIYDDVETDTFSFLFSYNSLCISFFIFLNVLFFLFLLVETSRSTDSYETTWGVEGRRIHAHNYPNWYRNFFKKKKEHRERRRDTHINVWVSV
jgi:hypothetical protein